ncbi:MAG: hypothetical protein ACRC6R_10205 [Bacteroidales bacterium]
MSKRNYKELYALVSRIPGYKAGEEGELMMQGLIWSHTKERTYKKSELTEREMNSLCAWIRKNYQLSSPKRKLPPSDGELDKWRKRVIAVVIENCELLKAGDRFEQNKVAYAKAVATRACEKEDFSKLTTAQLTAVYNRFLKENAIINREV